MSVGSWLIVHGKLTQQNLKRNKQFHSWPSFERALPIGVTMTQTITLGGKTFTVRQKKSALLWQVIWTEMELQHPMTVRQTFYRVESSGHVEKTESGYDRVQRQLLNMRRAG